MNLEQQYGVVLKGLQQFQKPVEAFIIEILRFVFISCKNQIIAMLNTIYVELKSTNDCAINLKQ